MILIYYGIQRRKFLLAGVLAHQKYNCIATVCGENATIMVMSFVSVIGLVYTIV